MADTVSTIGGGGADYGDVALWEADADVSSGRWIGEINTSTEMLNDDLTVDGITGSPDKDNFVWLRAASGFQHAGVWDTGKARIREDNGGHAIESYEAFTTITGVQVEQSSTTSSLECIRVYEDQTVADNQLIHNVICRVTGSGDDRDCIYMPRPPNTSTPSTVHISNTVCYGHDRGAINMQSYQTGNNRIADIQVLHCSIGDQGSGADNDVTAGGVVRYHKGGTIDVNCENVLVIGNDLTTVDGFRETDGVNTDTANGDFTGNNNISEDSSADDVETFTSSYGSVTIVTTAPTSGTDYAWLEDPTATDPDLSIAGENAYTVTQNGSASTATATQTTDGTTLVQDLSTDIAGNTRAATPCIGAFEFVSGGGVTVTAEDVSQGQAADAPTLTQTHTLTAEDIAQPQAADAPTLTQDHQLSAEDIAQSQTADAPTLSVTGELDAEEVSQAQAADAPTLTQDHQLTADDVAQSQSVEAPTVSQELTVTPEDVSQAQTVEAPVIVVQGVLVPVDVAQAQAIESPVITQEHVLAANDVAQAQVANAPAIGIPTGFIPEGRAIIVNPRDRASIIKLRKRAKWV